MFDVAKIKSDTNLLAVDYQTPLSSTNDRAIELIELGWQYPALVLTDQQTAGRGRGRNRWWSSESSLTFSWLVKPVSGLDLRFVPILVALAVCDAIQTFAEPLPVQLKWPNDVLISGRKLGGILIESREAILVIGIGINANHQVLPELEKNRLAPTSLYLETNRATDRTALLIQILRQLEQSFEDFARDEKVVDVWIGKYNDRLAYRDQTVEIESPQGDKMIGRCVGIDRRAGMVLGGETESSVFFSGTMRAV